MKAARNVTARWIHGMPLVCRSRGTWEEPDLGLRFDDGRRGWTWKEDGKLIDQQIYDTLDAAARAARSRIKPHCVHYYHGDACCVCKLDHADEEHELRRAWACRCGTTDNLHHECEACGAKYPGLCDVAKMPIHFPTPDDRARNERKRS